MSSTNEFRGVTAGTVPAGQLSRRCRVSYLDGPGRGPGAGLAKIPAENGNMYTVMIGDDGMFSAEYVVPPALRIPLGISGSTVDVVRNEDGTFSANGEVITAETRVTAANGNVYAAVLSPEGVPVSAMHVAAMQDVMLGELGGTVKLTQAEDMSWWLGETAVMDGSVHTHANGNMYVLMLDSEGMWSAMYQKVPVMVNLGTQESITLERDEDMSWRLGSEAVDVGSEVMSDSGNTYTLWYADGVWSAQFEPESMMIEGTGLVAMTKEDRSGYEVDGADLPGTLPALGTDIDTSMGTYRVTMMDGMLMGTRLDNVAIDGNTDDWNTPGLNSTPFIRVDEDDTEDVNEAATALVVDGENHPFSALLGSGVSQTEGKNFVAEARKDLMEIRSKLEALLSVFDGETQRDEQVRLLWGGAATDTDNRSQNVEDVLAKAFGTSTTELITATNNTVPDDNDALDEIDDMILALSSVDSLAEALDDDGVLKELGVDNNDKTATQIFDAVASETTVSYGALGETRFGAVSKKERSTAVHGLNYSQEDEEGVLGAFSFGVTGETKRAQHVLSAGNAFYDGATRAVDQGGTHYAGDISLRVRFATNQVHGLVSNLRSEQGDSWMYLFGEVESIALEAEMGPAGIWDGDKMASASFSLRAGSPGTQTLASTFSGRLLGTGENAGYQAVGTWSVGEDPDALSYLAGGFGAERVADEADHRPALDDGTVVSAKLGAGDGDMTALKNGELTLTVAQWGMIRTGGDLAGDDPTPTYTWQQVPDDSDTIDTDESERKYEIDLGLLVPKEGSEANVNGPKYVDMAREMIENERAKLVALLDTDQLEDLRAPIWRRIQEVLLTHVFNAEADEDQPLSDRLPLEVSGGYDEDSVLDTIDDILAALSSQSNLESALDTDESALFLGTEAETKGDNTLTDAEQSIYDFTGGLDAVDRSEIWAEKDSQVKLWIGTTDFTRFGVWRVRRSRNALRSNPGTGRWQDAESDAYAYSPLPASTITRSDSPNYPTGATANYQGRTVAFVGTTGHEGDVNVRVAWGPQNGEPIGAKIQTVITNLENVDGVPYTNGGEVRELVFPEVIMVVNDGGTTDHLVDFQETTGTVTLNAVDRTATLPGLDLTMHEGTFVGSSAHGPLGLIGRYKAGNITGAYGADLP